MIFDSIIKTERLILRCLDFSDAEHLFRLRSDPEYAEIFGWKPYTSIKQANDRIKRCREDNSCYVFSVLPIISAEAVGGICLWNINYENNTAEIGYDLEKEYRGKGYAQEACAAILRFAFDELKMKTVTAFPGVKNQPSVALLKKLNFKCKGTIKSTSESGDEQYDFRLEYSTDLSPSSAARFAGQLSIQTSNRRQEAE